jgi:hypothetical protein
MSEERLVAPQRLMEFAAFNDVAEFKLKEKRLLPLV